MRMSILIKSATIELTNDEVVEFNEWLETKHFNDPCSPIKDFRFTEVNNFGIKGGYRIAEALKMLAKSDTRVLDVSPRLRPDVKYSWKLLSHLDYLYAYLHEMTDTMDIIKDIDVGYFHE